MSQKWRFSKGVNPCFQSKNAIFFRYLFSLKIRPEKRFFNILDRKKSFFDYKNKIFYSLQNRLFPMLLVKKANLFSICFRLKQD